MSVKHFTTTHTGLFLGLLAGTVAISIGGDIDSVSDLFGTLDVFASVETPCQDTGDVIAALDRSRNGVSVTCNSDTLLAGVTR